MQELAGELREQGRSRAPPCCRSRSRARGCTSPRARSRRGSIRAGLHGVRRADHGARGGDRVLALQHERNQGSARDEVDQVREERLARVLAVVALGELTVDLISLSAAMRSPLRSKRAITSPVRPRSKASGLRGSGWIGVSRRPGPYRLGGCCDVVAYSMPRALALREPARRRGAFALGRRLSSVARCSERASARLPASVRAPWRRGRVVAAGAGTRPPPPRSRGRRASAGRAACRSWHTAP